MDTHLTLSSCHYTQREVTTTQSQGSSIEQRIVRQFLAVSRLVFYDFIWYIISLCQRYTSKVLTTPKTKRTH